MLFLGRLGRFFWFRFRHLRVVDGRMFEQPAMLVVTIHFQIPERRVLELGERMFEQPAMSVVTVYCQIPGRDRELGERMFERPAMSAETIHLQIPGTRDREWGEMMVTYLLLHLALLGVDEAEQGMCGEPFLYDGVVRVHPSS
jgi:hypothetical protein